MLRAKSQLPRCSPLSSGRASKDPGGGRRKGISAVAGRKSQPRNPTSWENKLISSTPPAPSPHPSAREASLHATISLALLLENCGVARSLIQPPFCSSSCWKGSTSVRSSRRAEMKWHDNSCLDDREQSMGLLKTSQGRPTIVLLFDLLRTCCTYLQDLHFAFWRQTLKYNSRWKSQACWESMWVFTCSNKTLSVPPLTILPGTFKTLTILHKWIRII